MDSTGHDATAHTGLEAQTAHAIRSSSAEQTPLHDASDASADQLPTSVASDDQSLTSFPSLSASLENSPTYLKATLSTPPNAQRRPASTPQIAHKPSTDTFDGLFSPRRPSEGRLALFDDTPKDVREVPGTLHLQSDDNVEHLIARIGAVSLVRQLSEDLARRDEQVTLLQRKAEERERLLKRMLRDCEVSNLDIEKRLKLLEEPAFESPDADKTPLSRRQNDRNGTSGSTRPEDSISDRMCEAFDDVFQGGRNLPVESLDTSQRNLLESRGTIRPFRNASRASLASGSSDRGLDGTSKRSTTRGWKAYFRPGGAANRTLSGERTAVAGVSSAQERLASINSAANARNLRKGLSSDIFKPPPPYSRSVSGASSNAVEGASAVSHEQATTDAESVRSSTSVASWALRLVAGPPQSDANGRRSSKPRSATAGSGATEAAPLAKTPSNTRNVSGPARSTLSQRNPIGLAIGPNGTTKKGDTDARSLADDDETNYGPVEMDTILPDEKRPPTLVQHPSQQFSSDYLTDRFGFIYDQRRRRRQHEAAALATVAAALPRDKNGSQVESLGGSRFSMRTANGPDGDAVSVSSNAAVDGADASTSADGLADEQQTKKWQDYLKLATFSTELLSHTPSAAPITSITTAEAEPEQSNKSSQVSMSGHSSLPPINANPVPHAENIVSGAAEFAGPAPSEETAPTALTEDQADPVKALLLQLTDVHDALQRERTVRWNEFLRKVRAERRRNGDANANSDGRSKGSFAPETLLADGEMIGVAGLGNKGKPGRAKWVEFRNLVLGGIPVTYRAKVWAECSGASAMKVPGYYDELANSTVHDPTVVQQIQMDITRTLTDNIFFREGQGVHKLREVLLAYARHNVEVGYCQGMNLITANLLLIMPTAEDAFWVLASMIENILPEKYYDHSLLTSRADQMVLRQYVTELLPALSSHLEELGIELEALTFQWFLSIFTDCLSAEALFRVWDVVLCINDGASFLFQVALALLKLNEKQLLLCDSPAGVYGYINQRMTDHAISIDGLIKASEGLKKEVQRDEVVKRRRAAVELELETARQREAIRKGKSRAVDAKPRTGSASNGQQTRSEQDDAKNKAAAVVEDIGSGRLTRRESALDAEDEAARFSGELTVRTPMPVDEEALWRA